MSDQLVLDASAAIALARREPGRETVLAALRAHVLAGGFVIVPGHFWLEVANVLSRRYHYGPSEIVQGVRVLDEFDMSTIELDRPLWLLTLDRMDAFGLAAYDALYLALAESLDASLLTLDGALADAAGRRAVRPGLRRMQETAAPYDPRQPGAVWAGFGEYISQLRREAAAG